MTDLHEAFIRGDYRAVHAVLESPEGFPNSSYVAELCDYLLGYAIFWSPLVFIRELLERGAGQTAIRRGASRT